MCTGCHRLSNFCFQRRKNSNNTRPSEGVNGEKNNARSGSSASSTTNLNPLDGIGWISDSKGNCIPGEYITNAVENSAKLFFAGFGAGAADAFSASQISIGTNGVSSVLSGDGLDFATGQGAASGLEAWADYIEQRAQEDFDVVHVESGREVVMHITNQIEIDYDTLGRKVNYFDENGVSNDLD